MLIALIIAVLLVLLLAAALYFQIQSAHKQAGEGEQLLKDYQKRVDEQQRLLDDYRALEKNFDNVGQGYEQALLAFDKMEEEKQKMLQAKQALEQSCHDLQEANGKLMQTAHKKYELTLPLIGQALEALTQPDGAQRAAAAIRKLADLNEVECQSAIEQIDTVAAEQIAQQAVSDSGILKATYFDFDVKISPDAGAQQLRTNRWKAIQALVALLDNAMKFTTEGRVVLNVSRQDDHIAFAVEDTGMGVAADDADKAFEPFTQLNTYFDGMGIGLTAARSIAQRLGGDVTLDTTYAGPGARFVLTLPV
jgi:signal transduction histidine kinase